jgi:glycosyl transferase family 25
MVQWNAWEMTMREPQPATRQQGERDLVVTSTAPLDIHQTRVAAYVINLDRSVDRWHDVRSQAAQLDIAIERVTGVDASQMGMPTHLTDKNGTFVRSNGRPMLPQEYGCYLAHLRALATFLASDAELAIVMEDDVTLQADLFPRVEAIVNAAPSAEVVKLLNHRAVWFRTLARTSFGDLIGRCAFGPQGSAACYLVTREGAEKLLREMNEIRFPFDLGLERGWETGIQVYTVRDNILSLSERALESQIADRAKYRSIKLRGYRRIPTHILRLVELARRIRYSLA